METIRKTLFYLLLSFGLLFVLLSVVFYALAFIYCTYFPWASGVTNGLLHLVLAGGIYYERSKICLYGIILLSTIRLIYQTPLLFSLTDQPYVFSAYLLLSALYTTLLILSLVLWRKKAL